MKRCADLCVTQDACTGGLAGLECVGATSSVPGLCLPAAPGVACVPATDFTYGSKGLGRCCTATWAGTAGVECEGGLCSQFGTGPFMCTRACTSPADCPGDYACLDVGDGYSVCYPGNSVTTCIP